MRIKRLKRIAVLWLVLGLVVAALFTGIAFAYAKVGELEDMAASESVPVRYVTAGAIEEYTGKCANGFYDIAGNFIAVDIVQKLNARILAHELGHYYAIMIFDDPSEAAAEKIACGLLLYGGGYVERLKTGFDDDNKNSE